MLIGQTDHHLRYLRPAEKVSGPVGTELKIFTDGDFFLVLHLFIERIKIYWVVTVRNNKNSSNNNNHNSTIVAWTSMLSSFQADC